MKLYMNKPQKHLGACLIFASTSSDVSFEDYPGSTASRQTPPNKFQLPNVFAREVKPATTPPVCEGTRTGGFVERDVSWIHTENGARAVEAILARLDACQSSWITWEYVSVALYDGVILRSVGSGYVLVSNRSVFFYGPFLVKSRMDRPGLPQILW